MEVAVLTGRENYRISNEHCSAYREKQKILILNSKTMLRSPPSLTGLFVEWSSSKQSNFFIKQKVDPKRNETILMKSLSIPN
ncbi:hypothetical protein [Bacillus sp. 166amftsu]|uniref:hypothetical protein n=1 Tax=Bacillus sp. 166amftsu TaxID=1761753 RepID=UPI001B8C5875|nr:hypothetical protein [Bacillus sp. 166amftsu]